MIFYVRSMSMMSSSGLIRLPAGLKGWKREATGLRAVLRLANRLRYEDMPKTDGRYFWPWPSVRTTGCRLATDNKRLFVSQPNRPRVRVCVSGDLASQITHLRMQSLEIARLYISESSRIYGLMVYYARERK